MPARTRSATRAAKASQQYYLRCTDVDGTEVTITYSATGEGTHLRWNYPEPQHREASPALTEIEEQMDEDADGDTMMTPPPCGAGWMPQTPMNQIPFDAGSVLRTPMKKTLQRSPDRIGFKGIDFWRGSGVLHGKMEVDKATGSIRYIPVRTPGAGADMTREEVVERQLRDSERIFLEQIDKLISRKEMEDAQSSVPSDQDGSDSGYEEMNQDSSSPERRVRFASQQGVVIIERTENEEAGPSNVGGRPPLGRRQDTEELDDDYPHDNRADRRLMPRRKSANRDSNKENDEHLGSVEVNGSSFEVIMRPRRSARLALRSPPKAPQPRWGPINAAAGPIRSPKKQFRRRLGPYATTLIDPVTYQVL